MLKIHLMTVLAYNAINFHLLGTLEKEKDPKNLCFLYKLKQLVFLFSSAAVGFCKCFDKVVFVLKQFCSF